MLHKPFYDPQKTYEENFQEGPFSAFADGEKFEETGEPAYEVFKQKVNLPFGIAAGPLVNGKFVKAAFDKGFDINVYKTVRSHKYPCNPWPNVVPLKLGDKLTLEMAEQGVVKKDEYTEPLAITNSFGVPSFDPEFWQKDMKEAKEYAKKGQFLVGSFQGTVNPNGNVQEYIQDFVTTAKLVKETGVHVMEVNLSCPNEGTAHMLCFDIERTTQIVTAIKEEIGNIPLVIKIAYFPDQEQLIKLVKQVGHVIQGIAAINTIQAKIIDENGNQALSGGPERVKAGVCGHPIKWAGLEMNKRLKQLREELGLSYELVGVGGVETKEDYQEYREAGADAVMSVTGAMWNPFLAQEIKKAV